MTPQSEYSGGGTVDHELPMDIGHGTFRPGAVLHGGHRVTSGAQYILGVFLLLEDHVKLVWRLKNRGSELRTSGDLQGAIKDWAEVLLYKKIREA